MVVIFGTGLLVILGLNWINYDKLYKLACEDMKNTSKRVTPEDYSFNISVLSPLICVVISVMLNELYNTLHMFFEPTVCYFIISTLMLIQQKKSGNTVSWIASCIEIIVLIYSNVNMLALLKLIVNLQMIQIQKHAYTCVWNEEKSQETPSEPVQSTRSSVKIRTINVQPANRDL
jgi:hypothetical protein